MERLGLILGFLLSSRGAFSAVVAGAALIQGSALMKVSVSNGIYAGLRLSGCVLLFEGVLFLAIMTILGLAPGWWYR